MSDIQCPKCGDKDCEGEAIREKRPYWLDCECECGFVFSYNTITDVYYSLNGEVIK